MAKLPAEKRDYARRLRSNQTEAETALWSALRGRQIHGCKFRRQAVIGDFIVDFVCYDAKLIIEVDGVHHQQEGVREYDGRRTEWLQSQGFRVLRFSNAEVIDDFHSVRQAISAALNEKSQ